MFLKCFFDRYSIKKALFFLNYYICIYIVRQLGLPIFNTNILIINKPPLMNMKKHITPARIFIGLFLCIVFLSSFSVEYSREYGRENMPKEQRYQMRLEKRKDRLQERMDKTKNTYQRQAIQKKIQKIQQKQDDGGTPVLGILGMVLSILAFILFLVFLFASLFNAVGAITGALVLAYSVRAGLLIASIIAGLSGLILSIVGLSLNKKDPDKFSGKGFAVAGMIIGIIICSLLLIAAIIFFLL